MAGWDDWAKNVMAVDPTIQGAALYCPSTGAAWGRSGKFSATASLHQYDTKAGGKDASVPEIDGLKYMFIRKTMDDDPVSVFKKGEDSYFTTKGPSGCRVGVVVKGKPETAISKVVSYLKPHV